MIEIAVCDDDANDLERAAGILLDIFSAQNIACNIKTFLSAREMLDSAKKIDIGILDIAMNELNGISLGRKLKERFPDIKLIYATSYEEYCMQAVNDVHAFSFLCKPLDSHKMHRQIIEALHGIPDHAAEKEFYKVTDSRQKEYTSIKLKLKDILYLGYVKRSRKAQIVLAEETYECECVFKQLEEELQQYDFAVNSRGNLVNLRHVKKIKGFSIFLDNGKELPIAQKRIVDFRIKMNEFLQGNS